jgi:hypothetical protein
VGEADNGGCDVETLPLFLSDLGRLKRRAINTALQLLLRFRDAGIPRDDLQAFASQGMALLPRLQPLSAELMRVLGTSPRSHLSPAPVDVI